MTDEISPPRDIDPVIGGNVRAELARRGISQDRLGEVLGISQSQVSKRLSGIVGFRAAELVRISTDLHIPMARLVKVEAAA